MAATLLPLFVGTPGSSFPATTAATALVGNPFPSFLGPTLLASWHCMAAWQQCRACLKGRRREQPCSLSPHVRHWAGGTPARRPQPGLVSKPGLSFLPPPSPACRSWGRGRSEFLPLLISTAGRPSRQGQEEVKGRGPNLQAIQSPHPASLLTSHAANKLSLLFLEYLQVLSCVISNCTSCQWSGEQATATQCSAACNQNQSGRQGALR